MSFPETSDAVIPVIDLSDPSPFISQKVLDAASTHGFLFIQNDGTAISPTDIGAMFNLSRQYFGQSAENKAEYPIHSERAGGINRGWVRMEGESLDPEGEKQPDPKEAFNIAPPYPSLQPLPAPLSHSTELITRFQTACHTLCTTILSHLNKALEIPDPEYFSSRHDLTAGTSGTIMRMLYYPSSSQATASREPRIRAGAHSDYGSLTLLFRLPGESGLELLRPNGEWASVPVNPQPDSLSEPPILVNIGDLLSFWTNGMLKSTVHRVTFSGGKERYSMAYFCHPLDEARLDVVPSRVVTEYGPKGAREMEAQRRKVGLEEGDDTVLSARQHLERRLKVTYGL